MARLAEVFTVLNDIKREGVIEEYAIGGAMALLFYIEPATTYDLDVFVSLPAQQGVIIDLGPLYSHFRALGFETDREHIRIYDVPVQLLPAYNPLVEEAVREAIEMDYEGVPVRVVDPDHLAAIALQTGGEMRRARATKLISDGAADLSRVNNLLVQHGLPLVRQEG